MHAGEAVAEALRAEGVERVYSVPGSHIHPIYDGLSRVPSIRFVTCKQEPNVSLMADAYGRLTGKPGVCLVTAGPGSLKSMAGVAQAYGAASPLIHIAGAVPLQADKEAFHGVDDPAFVHYMFGKITKWSERIERLQDIPEVMAQAFQIARSGRPGPVHVELPRVSDYSEYILQEQPAELAEYRPLRTVCTAPDPGFIERVVARVKAARAPVIAAGKGIIRQQAMAELAALAAKLQAPVVCAQDAIGVVPEVNPFFAGHFQQYRSHPLCVDALHRTDLVLGIGLRADTAELTALRANAPERAFLLAGFDDAANAANTDEDECVVDPKRFLVALLERAGLVLLGEALRDRPQPVRGLVLRELQHPGRVRCPGVGVIDVHSGIDDHPGVSGTDPPGALRLPHSGEPVDLHLGISHPTLHRPVTDPQRRRELRSDRPHRQVRLVRIALLLDHRHRQPRRQRQNPVPGGLHRIDGPLRLPRHLDQRVERLQLLVRGGHHRVHKTSIRGATDIEPPDPGL
jgi:hypothetical protein